MSNHRKLIKLRKLSHIVYDHLGYYPFPIDFGLRSRRNQQGFSEEPEFITKSAA
jgi:hypothetical protein